MLRYRQIFDFYWPLLLTSQMMTLAAPLINMGLSRNADPKVQLAAYAVGFSLMLLFNSPLFPFPQTVVVLGVGPRSRRSLYRKGMFLASAIATVELLIALTPLGDWLFREIMGSTPAVSALAKQVALVQCPIPLLLVTRSLFYGIVMRHRNTRIITQSTSLRLALLASIIFGASNFDHMPGAALGAASLTLGILTETVYVAFRVYRLLRRDASGINEVAGDGPVTWSQFFGFVAPLMVNAVTWTAMRTVVNAVLGRTSDPDLAQAGFGFVFPLLVLSASPLWAFQSTTVVLAKRREDLPTMFRFGAATITLFVLGIALVIYTPLRELLLRTIFPLTSTLALYVVPGLLLIPYQPITLGLRTISQGFLMAQRRTTVIGAASALKLVLVALIGFPLVLTNPHFNGALLGTALLMGSETVETVIILTAVHRVYRFLGAQPSESIPVPD
jgi:hypothetical protein